MQIKNINILLKPWIAKGCSLNGQQGNGTCERYYIQTCIFPHVFFSKEQFLSLVRAYCESDSFWNWNSRTLIESFCSFVVEKSDLTEEEKMIFLIDGIYSGISTNSKNSPWQSEINHISGKSTTEEIILDKYFSLSSLNKADHLSDITFANKMACLRLHNENGKVAISLKETA
ncbi:hypothetical protein [Dickeya ananatis]